MATNILPEPTAEQYAAFGRFVAAQMGANLEWDSAADYLEYFSEKAQNVFGHSIGSDDDDVLAMWRSVADDEGIDYPDDEIDEEEIEEEE